MSKKANTTLIGAFVIIGLILFISATIIFSSGSLFTKKMTFYVSFDTSLNGLDIGAPVKFKGVGVGAVESIEVVYNNETDEAVTVVIFNINANLFKTVSRRKMKVSDYNRFYTEQIMRGLAAKLSIESLLTAKLYVGLDYYGNEQERFSRDINLKKHQQMPSVATDLDEIIASFDVIVKRLSNVEFEKISKKTINLLDKLNSKLESFDFESVNKAMDAISDVLAFDSSTREAMDNSLEQLAKMLRSLRVLLDFLERNPNAIVAGKVL